MDMMIEKLLHPRLFESVGTPLNKDSVIA